jgi:glycosyltransferase 2 family protein
MKNIFITLIKVAITALFFFYIYNKTDIRQFVAIMRNARLNVLISGFILLWSAHFICIFRWRLLMRPLMPIPSVMNLFGIYCIGLFFNLTFPTVIGGDIVKVYYAGKPAKAYAESFASTFLDRDAGMLAMMIIACIAISFYPVHISGIPVSWIIWGVFALFILGNVAIFAPGIHRLLISLLHRAHLPKIAAKIDMISGAFQIMGQHKSVLWGALIISFINQILVNSVTWIMALGLGIHIRPYYFLILVPVITLISMIPISINGMGLRETAFLSLFGAIGVPNASCIALGLLSSIVLIVSSLPGGIVYLFFRNKADMQQMAVLETEFS